MATQDTVRFDESKIRDLDVVIPNSEYSTSNDTDDHIAIIVSKEDNTMLPILSLNNSELVLVHTLTHMKYEDTNDARYCRLHFKVANEILRRGMAHIGNTHCDRAVALIRGDLDTYIKNIREVEDAPLKEDWAICVGWYSSIKDGKKINKHIGTSTIPLTIEDIKKLGVAIANELLRRGIQIHPEKYEGNVKEFWESIKDKVNMPDKEASKDVGMAVLPEYSDVTDIDWELIQKMSNEELNKLWEWLHETWRNSFKDGKVTEDYLNANALIQAERFNRGIIDYSYEDKDELDKHARHIWQEYREPKLESDNNENTEIALDYVLEAFNKIKAIVPEDKPIGYLCGGIVNEGKISGARDIDLVITERPTPSMLSSITSALPNDIAKRLHIFYSDNAGLIGYSIPILSKAYVITDKQKQVRGFYPSRAPTYYADLSIDIKVGKYIVGVKPKSGFGKNEFYDLDEMWKKWGINHIPCYVEEKVDGRRIQTHIGEDSKVVAMFSEDTATDRKNVFPKLVAELESLGLKNAILDGEMLMFNLEGKNFADAKTKRKLCSLVPREDTAIITSGNQIPEDKQESLVYVLYDIMLLNNDPVCNMPYSDRRNIYSGIISKRKKLKYLDCVNSELASNMKGFYASVQRMRTANGSEGAVCKDATFVYPIKFEGDNRSGDMAKIKNLKEIDCIVLKVIEKKQSDSGEPMGQYVYECGVLIDRKDSDKYEGVVEKDGKYYITVGKSYSTAEKCNVGDIITAMPIRVRFYESTKEAGKQAVTWMFPYFKEKRTDKNVPDTIETLRRISEAGTSPIAKKQ